MKTKISNKDIKLIIITLLIGLVLGWLFFHSPGKTEVNDLHETAHEETKQTMYTCSMHPQIKQDHPGDCPICGMELIPMETGGHEEHMDANEVQMSEAAMALADIQTSIVQRGDAVKHVLLQGKIQSDERNVARLTARFGGRIEKLFINFTGQKVVKGQKLATIYSPELIAAQKELLEAAKYKTSNPSLFNAAVTKLKLWDLTERQIEDVLSAGTPRDNMDILAPISGTVTQRNIAMGDYVKEGTALFEVVDLSKVWVVLDAYERDLPWLKQKDKVSFTVAALPGKTFSSSISFIDPVLQSEKRVAEVRLEVVNQKGELKPEMFVNADVESLIATNNKFLQIPKSAVLWTGKRSVVYVKVQNREQPSFLNREIILGPAGDDFYVVESGLTEGEEIATNGVFKIDAAAQLEGKASMMNPGDDSETQEQSVMKMNMDQMDIKTKQASKVDHQSFHVSGNCEMCKNTIETAAKSVPGVSNANWNVESKVFTVDFDSTVTNIDAIHKAISAAGYDTDKMKGDDKVYENLPACCHYERK